MKTRPIEPNEKFVSGMLLYYRGYCGGILPPLFLLIVEVPPLPFSVQYPKLKHLTLLDGRGKIKDWEITKTNGSPRGDIEIVVLEDEDGDL